MAFDLKNFITDPLPDYAFELSDAGIAWVRPASPGQPAFAPLADGVISVSPLRDNVGKPDVLAGAVDRITEPKGARKRGRAVLILPDFCARVAVLDFDAFPSDAQEQASLVRFRMKKSVPFDVESATVRFHAQSPEPGTSRLNVVVVVAALEILARYEAPFRAAGLHAGHVTTSSLMALELDRSPGISVMVKLSGKVLSVSVLKDGILRLLRTVEMADADASEMLGVLFPTLVYVEDELGGRPARLLGCGMDGATLAGIEAEVGVPTEPLSSRFGAPGQHNAGLLGYLESLK